VKLPAGPTSVSGPSSPISPDPQAATGAAVQGVKAWKNLSLPSVVFDKYVQLFRLLCVFLGKKKGWTPCE
jgi:hypothetical protein